jgi:Transposase DDE domain group 1
MSGCISDSRRAETTRHSVPDLLRQRIYQIVCGYEDQNDATLLREDPLFELVCGCDPALGAERAALASQPTLSRLENSIRGRECYALSLALVELYIQERTRAAPNGQVKRVRLDFDSTADPVHGSQEGEAYNGHYREHIYHPLLCYDADTGDLITAILRPGSVGAKRGVVAVLKRLAALLRRAWPGVQIELRADAGFACPELYDYCEDESIQYSIGFGTNERLAKLSLPLLATAQAKYIELVERLRSEGKPDEAAQAKVRLVGETLYKARRWKRERRVVIKAEVLPEGPNVRFAVTSYSEPKPEAVYDDYVDRGQAELYIKDFKRALKADRLSCHRFVANQFRLLLHAAAYAIFQRLRRWLKGTALARVQMDTLRLRLIKVGGWVEHRGRQVILHLSDSYPWQTVWAHLAQTAQPASAAA